MYQLFSGKLPFQADSPTAMIFQHAYEQPPRLEEISPEIPKPVVAIISRLMDKDAAARYQTAEEVLDDIAAFRAGKPLAPVARAGQGRGEAVAGQPSVIITAPDFDLVQDEQQLTSTVIEIPKQDLTWRRNSQRR